MTCTNGRNESLPSLLPGKRCSTHRTVPRDLSESPLHSRLSWCLELFAPVSVLAYHILLWGFKHAPGSLCEHGYGKKAIADLGNRALGSGSDRVGLHGACKPHKILRPCQRRIPEMAYCHRACTPVHSLSPNDFWILLDLAPAACQLIRTLVSTACFLPVPACFHAAAYIKPLRRACCTSHAKLSHKSRMGLLMTTVVAGAISSPREQSKHRGFEEATFLCFFLHTARSMCTRGRPTSERLVEPHVIPNTL